MRIRSMSVAGICAAALLGGGALAGAADNAEGSGADSAADGAAKAAAIEEDFDGDGYQDVAVGAPGGTVDGQAETGYVTVLYGGPDGPGARHAVVSQATAGVPGGAEAEDRFGEELAARDVDGDGLADLVVAAPGEDGGEVPDAGAVTALWGSEDGLTGEGAVRIAADGYPDGYGLGGRLETGDFDGDGNEDLLLGRSDAGYSVLYGPFNRQGEAASEVVEDFGATDGMGVEDLVVGDVTGDGADDVAAFHSFEEMAEGGMFYRGGAGGFTPGAELPHGAAGTVGDFDADGYGDLAIRQVPGGVVENLPYDAGSVQVIPGSAEGPDPSRATVLTQETEGVPGVDEDGDQFGARLAAGDVDADGDDDLAVGIPFEAINDAADSGSTVLLKGGDSGLTGAGAQAFAQITDGVPGTPEAGDRFGGSVQLLDTDADGHADLTAGAPAEDGTDAADSGRVTTLPGSPEGLTADGATAAGPEDVGAPAAGARFGTGLSASTNTFLHHQDY